MKQILLLLCCIILLSCEEKEPVNYEIGEGIEFYMTEIPYIHNLYKDYSLVNFDTIALKDKPVLRYKDFLKFDTTSYIITLGVSHDSINMSDAGVYGRMFVITLDKNPIYCGFYWRVMSSVPCNWVFIEEPYEELDHLKNNEIKLSFHSQQYPDPRLDSRIINRLKTDGKIK